MFENNCIISRLQGRTGNMMFQIAHGYSKALEYNRQFVVPKEESSSSGFENNLFKKITFNIKKSEDIPNAEMIQGTFHFTDLPPFDHKPTIFSGWFQSEKYFGKYTEPVRDLFYPPKEFVEQALRDFPFLFESSKTVAINVRRGDYLTQSHNHPVVTKEYIEQAYKLLPPHKHTLVVSDDIDWCKDHINIDNTVYIDPAWYDGKYWDHQGIWLLSLCDYFVISNSTFSWWGAWLSRSKDKVVVAPSTWFGTGIQEKTDDIYCKDWIKLQTYYENGEIKV